MLKISNLSFAYGSQQILKSVNLSLTAGDVAALIGDNGSGKTTLLKIIMGQIQPDCGQVIRANNLKIGYVAQNELGFDTGVSFLSQVDTNAGDAHRAAVVMGLQPFELNVPINNLSRGKMTKLAILKLLLDENDLIILDEPTNHLDIRAIETIELALSEYDGAMILVTHDEEFAKRVGTSKIIHL